jgi:hypothetical protein
MEGGREGGKVEGERARERVVCVCVCVNVWREEGMRE